MSTTIIYYLNSLKEFSNIPSFKNLKKDLPELMEKLMCIIKAKMKPSKSKYVVVECVDKKRNKSTFVSFKRGDLEKC